MADLTFLMNADPSGDSNQFYTLARRYFVLKGSAIVDAPAAGQTLEGVFKELVRRNVAQKTINLVSHASGFASMESPVTLASQASGRRTMTVDDLQDALAAKSLAPPGPAIITKDTRVVIYGCDVGRSEAFLRMLSGLFGDPFEVLAPRRLGVFVVDGANVQYRQAQTWTLVRNPPLILGGAATPAGGWANYRTKFVDAALLKFGRIAIPDEPVGPDRLKTMLTDAAKNATRALGPTFFLEEGIQIFPQGAQSAAAAAASLAPRSNGDPVTALPKTALELDDTTVVTTVKGSDAYPANPAMTEYAITVSILAHIIDRDVVIGEGADYRRVTASKGLAPSPGPKAVGAATGSGGDGAGASDGESPSEIQSMTAELLALGAEPGDIDEIFADAPQGDGTEDLATASPDELFSVGDLDYPVPDPEVA